MFWRRTSWAKQCLGWWISKFTSIPIYPVEPNQTEIYQASFLRLVQVFRWKYIAYNKPIYFVFSYHSFNYLDVSKYLDLWLHTDKLLEYVNQYDADLYVICICIQLLYICAGGYWFSTKFWLRLFQYSFQWKKYVCVIWLSLARLLKSYIFRGLEIGYSCSMTSRDSLLWCQ